MVNDQNNPSRPGTSGAVTLHYILDPLCGWCYAVAPLIQAAHKLLPIQLHAGGMMAGPNRRAGHTMGQNSIVPFRKGTT